MAALVTLRDNVRGAISAEPRQSGPLQRPLCAGARRAAGAAREGTVPQFTHRNQGGILSADAADKRRTHAEARIDAARHPWTKFLKTAEWLVSELQNQAVDDPATAKASAESLYTQTRQFAETLNKQAKGDS